ncbi:hypothetical protein [uncultured Oscillibacter sp.]|uniref:hypothetical protein n=1 Tax=uncultured Oscillibacter sp. TaxID=876091 RepID=UPI002605E9B7|nr:hypothetical protein [uncultured Oscillibacter sp.]
MSGPYDDIIDLPHPTSQRHPRMPMANRAAQFSPFAALSGYDDAVKETARLTDSKVELTEEEKVILDAKLQLLVPGMEASFTYFQQDDKKEGGAYLTVTGTVKKFDSYAREIVLGDGRRMPIDDILELQSEALGN